MLKLLERDVELSGADCRLEVIATGRVDGDVHPVRVAASTLADRQVGASGREWSMLDQVHGTSVIDLDRLDRDPLDRDPLDTESSSGRRGATVAIGDVAHTDTAERPVAIWAADCAAVVLLSAGGRLVAAHAGWRGLSAGVIDAALDAAGRTRIVAAVLGPVIHPCCYEFGDADREAVERGVGARVGALAATTSDGRAALDVPAAVAAALARRDVRLDVVGPCTGCDDSWFSHRVRRDRGRHAIVGWMSSMPTSSGTSGSRPR